MRFYNRQHRHYCGIDLHAKTMYICIHGAGGQVLVHRNVKSTPEAFLEAIASDRDDLVVAAEYMFTWYWLADLCATEGLAFVLGHALAMKAIHGGKAKHDKIDSHTIASLSRTNLGGPCFTCDRVARSSRWRSSSRRRGASQTSHSSHVTTEIGRSHVTCAAERDEADDLRT